MFQLKYYFDFYRLNTTEKHTVEIWQDNDASVEALISTESAYERAVLFGYAGTIEDYIDDLSEFDGTTGENAYSDYQYQVSIGFTGTFEEWVGDATLDSGVEITGMAEPLIIEMPELDNKFQTVRGKGCSLTLLSETDGQFFDALYHVNPTEIKLIHKISDVISNVFYLDSEMMQEPYSENKNYPVNITGNDGLGLLDRFSFLQPDETNYVGVKSQLEILQICFNKIGLWADIGIWLATKPSPDHVVTSILHDSYNDCANFYDEDGKPMSLREVVESILTPYGAHVETKGESVLITDIHTKATETLIWYYMFALEDLSILPTQIVGISKAITAASYRGTGSDKERSGGVNRQVVSYSPYTLKTIDDNSLVGVDEFETVPETFSTKDGYKYKTLSGNEVWEIDAAKAITDPPSTFEASYYTDERDTNVYFRRPLYEANDEVVLRFKSIPDINITGEAMFTYDGERIVYPPKGEHRRSTTNAHANYTDGVALKITGELLPKTKNNPYDDNQASNEHILSLYIKVRIKVGDYYCNGITWTTTPATVWLHVNGATRDENISDKWTKIGYKADGAIFPIRGLSEDLVLSGQLEIELLTTFYFTTLGGPFDPGPGYVGPSRYFNSQNVQEIWHKNFAMQLVNRDGSEIADDDIEYIGILNKNFINEGEAITLTTGTDSRFCDKGKIMKQVDGLYRSIKLWTRAGQTFKIEELLLNSLCSNYKSGYITLTGMKLKADFNPYVIFTDVNLPGVKLMVKSAKIDYSNNVAEVTLVEITADQLTIIKE